MRILAVDVGTGTQDILLFDTDLQPENCFKLVMPSPTMRVARQVRAALRDGAAGLVLTGVTMGGGPSHWAVRDFAAAGRTVYATPDAARTFDDDLARVREMGVTVVGEEEAVELGVQDGMLRLALHDFDYAMIARAFAAFGMPLELDGLAVAVFDHGAAPPDVSDRQFRFDYLDARIRQRNDLSAFAFRAGEEPPSMTRLRAVVSSAQATDAPGDVPLMVMDTAPAAVLGATLDPRVGGHRPALVANVGNFHTLAFRLGEGGIDGVFEHHTGLIDVPKLDGLIRALADSTLRHEAVFDDHGHGALVYNPHPMLLDEVAVTGPRRAMMRESSLPSVFAVPYGDMMLAGCFGLVRAWADVHPGDADAVLAALHTASSTAPWELIES